MIASKSKERVINQIRDILLRVEERLLVIESKLKTKDKKKVIHG
jgi:hypothetical protein